MAFTNATFGGAPAAPFGANPPQTGFAFGAAAPAAPAFGAAAPGNDHLDPCDEFADLPTRTLDGKISHQTVQVMNVQRTAISCLSLTNPIDGAASRILAGESMVDGG